MRTSLLTSLVFLIINVSTSKAQEWSGDNLTIYKSFDSFEKAILNKSDDNVYVINFWATWCGPCVKELPYFESLHDIYKNEERVKVVLVSLDFEKQIERRLIPFLNKHEIKSDVVLLLDPKESTWIDKVDPSWSGSIPITIIKSGDRRKFYEQVFHSPDELKGLIDPLLKTKK